MGKMGHGGLSNGGHGYFLAESVARAPYEPGITHRTSVYAQADENLESLDCGSFFFFFLWASFKMSLSILG